MVWSRPKYGRFDDDGIAGPGHGPQRDLHGLGGAVGDEQVSRIRVDAACGQMAQHFMLERGQAGAGRIGAQQTRILAQQALRDARQGFAGIPLGRGAGQVQGQRHGWAVSA